MTSSFIDTTEDIQWLKDTALRGVTLPTVWHDWRFAVIQGNEDAPHAVNLYLSAEPKHDADYLRLTFEHEAPVYCEYQLYDGKTGKPKGMPLERAL